LRDPKPTQNLKRARLYGERTRFVHTIKLPVDDPDSSAEGMKLARKSEPSRTRADDEDVRLGLRRHSQ
jgi:hypothetical protein